MTLKDYTDRCKEIFRAAKENECRKVARHYLANLKAVRDGKSNSFFWVLSRPALPYRVPLNSLQLSDEDADWDDKVVWPPVGTDDIGYCDVSELAPTKQLAYDRYVEPIFDQVRRGNKKLEIAKQWLDNDT